MYVREIVPAKRIPATNDATIETLKRERNRRFCQQYARSFS